MLGAESQRPEGGLKRQPLGGCGSARVDADRIVRGARNRQLRPGWPSATLNLGALRDELQDRGGGALRLIRLVELCVGDADLLRPLLQRAFFDALRLDELHLLGGGEPQDGVSPQPTLRAEQVNQLQRRRLGSTCLLRDACSRPHGAGSRSTNGCGRGHSRDRPSQRPPPLALLLFFGDFPNAHTRVGVLRPKPPPPAPRASAVCLSSPRCSQYRRCLFRWRASKVSPPSAAPDEPQRRTATRGHRKH